MDNAASYCCTDGFASQVLFVNMFDIDILA